MMWRHSFGKHHPENTEEDRDSVGEEPASSEFNTASFGNFLEVSTGASAVRCRQTCLSTTLTLEISVQVSKNKLTVRYVGNGVHNNDVGAIQGNWPVPRQRSVYYFEVHVDDAGDRGLIGIGFGDGNFRLQKQPGYVVPACCEAAC